MEEGPKFSRRQFLKIAAVTIAEVLLPFPKRPTSAEAYTKDTSKEWVYQHSIEVIDGVNVYGTRERIDTVADLSRLYGYFEDEFRKEAKAKKYPDPVPRNYEDWFIRSESVLENDKRFVQVIVGRSLYEQFKQEAEEGRNITVWLNDHVSEMNRMISDLQPPVGKKTVLKRIIVVDDSFSQDKQAKLPEDWPWDIDGSWNLWEDVRKSTAFGKKIDVKGNTRTIDFGLIHEWFHMLYSVADEYIQDVVDSNIRPDFKVIADGIGIGLHPQLERIRRRTPWIAYSINGHKERGFKGYYRDPAEQEIIWSKKPTKVDLRFLDPQGNALTGEAAIHRVQFQPGGKPEDYYGKKTFIPLKNTITLDEGCLTFPDTAFDTQSVEGREGPLYPTNWVIKIRTDNGTNYLLHLPAAGFNMSAIAGVKEAKYDVQFMQDGDTPLNLEHYLEIVNKTGLYSLKDSNPIARMHVIGTDAEMLWYASSEHVG